MSRLSSPTRPPWPRPGGMPRLGLTFRTRRIPEGQGECGEIPNPCNLRHLHGPTPSSSDGCVPDLSRSSGLPFQPPPRALDVEAVTGTAGGIVVGECVEVGQGPAIAVAVGPAGLGRSARQKGKEHSVAAAFGGLQYLDKAPSLSGMGRGTASPRPWRKWSRSISAAICSGERQPVGQTRRTCLIGPASTR